MKRNKLYPLFAIVVIVSILFCSCAAKSSNSSASLSGGNYDKLVGQWYVAGIYYNDYLIDINDNETLSDLYDTDMITFNEDGTFVKYNLFMDNGVCQPVDDDENTFILNTESVTKYNTSGGKLVEEETDNKPTPYVISFLGDEYNTIIFNDYEKGNLYPEIGESTLVFVKSGETSSYINENKAILNSNSATTTSSYSYEPTTSSYSYVPTTDYSSGYASSGERNALEKAYQYLKYSAFSYTGLIEQLEYEGYSNSEATYAADNCGADWYEQAAKKAKQYLDYSSFSRSGLVDQLEYEGFTHSQAEYGVSVAY